MLSLLQARKEMLPTVLYSNRIEQLYEHLCHRLYAENTSLFTKRLVVVPSQVMRTWLMNRMALDPRLGIVAGVDICFVDQALRQLREAAAAPDGGLPQELQLALAIEQRVRECIQSEAWHSVAQILRWEKGGLQSERRLVAFSLEMARLIRRYGTYAPQLIEDWCALASKDWQQELVSDLFREHPEWITDRAALAEVKKRAAQLTGSNIQVHLFSLSFIPDDQTDLFLHLGQYTPVAFYNLSPCEAFWTDIRSDRENRWMRKLWLAQGVDDKQLEELMAYLRDRNPLLANFGKLGRAYNRFFEEMDAQVAEDYVPPETDTLLGSIQADLLSMDRGDPSLPRFVDASDRTLQVHVAPSPWREIEILYDNLMRLVEREGFSPSDFVVMAPDISVYKPYIEAIFGSEESQLDYQLMDLQLFGQNALAQGLERLFSLAFGRWKASDLMQLFEDSCFRRKARLTGEEVQRIRGWLKAAGVRWGQSAEHRETLLKRDLHRGSLIERRERGTWLEGIGRMILGLSMVYDEDTDDAPMLLPVERMGMTDAELVAVFLRLFESLKADLRPLSDGSKMTCNQWTRYIRCLIDVYFDGEKEEREAIEAALRSLERAAEVSPDATVTFTTVRRHLTDLLNATTVSARESHVQAVRFCSMLPMRAIPAQVIALIGMGEQQYPRRERPLSLNRIAEDSTHRYCPTRSDYDRYLFLEAILSARHTFYMSYASGAREEASFPSILITELLEEVDRGYRLGEETPSKQLVSRHPFYRHDPAYFSGSDAPLQSYSQAAFRLASAKAIPSVHFVPEWTAEEVAPHVLESAPEQREIEIRDLMRCMRSPLSVYLRKTLGMSFAQDDPENEDNLEFVVHPWMKGRLRHQLLLTDTLTPLQRADQQGELPIGVFKDVAEQDLLGAVEEWKQVLEAKHWPVDGEYRIELSRSCHAAKELAKGFWKMPAPTITLASGEKVSVVGELKEIYSRGQLFLGKGNPAEFIRAWPQHLVLSLLSGPCGAETLAVKDGKLFSSAGEDPEGALAQILAFYLSCEAEPCPLSPDLMLQIGTKEKTEWPTSVSDAIDSQWMAFSPEELDWLLTAMGDINDHAVFEHWASRVRAMLEPMLEACFAKARSRS